MRRHMHACTACELSDSVSVSVQSCPVRARARTRARAFRVCMGRACVNTGGRFLSIRATDAPASLSLSGCAAALRADSGAPPAESSPGNISCRSNSAAAATSVPHAERRPRRMLVRTPCSDRGRATAGSFSRDRGRSDWREPCKPCNDAASAYPRHRAARRRTGREPIGGPRDPGRKPSCDSRDSGRDDGGRSKPGPSRSSSNGRVVDITSTSSKFRSSTDGRRTAGSARVPLVWRSLVAAGRLEGWGADTMVLLNDGGMTRGSRNEVPGIVARTPGRRTVKSTSRTVTWATLLVHTHVVLHC
jgi:hypothetical protein